MRPPSVNQYAGVPLNMTPMIDVVFQLIVFFTCTTTIAKTEYIEGLTLPAATKGKDVDPANPRRIITANVTSTGDVHVAGRIVTAREFGEMLTSERGDRQSKDLEVIIRGDQTTNYGTVEPLLLACARAGIWQVSFAVRQPDQK